MSKRNHILSLTARNIKSIKEVVINDVGELLEIRGDSGQGKTTILQSIEAALTGIDPSLVRRGADSAEIILDLDTATVRRVLKADSGREKVEVTDRNGNAVMKAKDFLATIYNDSTIFRPLDFVALGSGEAKGRTERLRLQRKMLLDAVKVAISEEELLASVVAHCGEGSDQVLRSTVAANMGQIDYSEHALTIVAGIERTLHGVRKLANDRLKEKQQEAMAIRVPENDLPESPDLAALSQQADEAYRASVEASAAFRSYQANQPRIEKLKATIAKADAELPSKDELAKHASNLDKAGLPHLREKVKMLEAELAEARKTLADAEAERAQIARQFQSHETVDAYREELAALLSASSVDADHVEALRHKSEEASARVRCAELLQKRAAALKEVQEQEARCAKLQALVVAFRDEIPKSILDRMSLPVEGLTITEEGVFSGGVPLAQLGTSEQIKIAVAIAAAINPKTGFILIDRAESLGRADRAALAEACREQGIQPIMTFVDPDAAPGAANVVVMRDGAALRGPMLDDRGVKAAEALPEIEAEELPPKCLRRAEQ